MSFFLTKIDVKRRRNSTCKVIEKQIYEGQWFAKMSLA